MPRKLTTGKRVRAEVVTATYADVWSLKRNCYATPTVANGHQVFKCKMKKKEIGKPDEDCKVEITVKDGCTSGLWSHAKVHGVYKPNEVEGYGNNGVAEPSVEHYFSKKQKTVFTQNQEKAIAFTMNDIAHQVLYLYVSFIEIDL